MKVYKNTHIGQRSNNEDALGNSENVFIICDGVGGSDKGEVASKFVVEETLKEINDSLFILSKVNLQKLLKEVQNRLNEKLYEQNASEGMGTTFCGLFFDESAVYAAHIGDSRIYWLKPQEQKVWHTWDHSIVGELLKSGQISREEARTHPMGNRISRAISANKERNTSIPEVHKISNTACGDIFFICTDGVNEAWNEFELLTLLSNPNHDLQQKGDAIAHRCQAYSRDNNTFYIIELEDEDVINQGDNDEIEWLALEDVR